MPRPKYKLKLRCESSSVDLNVFDECDVAVDCSCEIWMTVVRYIIPTYMLDIAITDLPSAISLIYTDIANRCCRQLESYPLPIKEYVFDHPTHINPHKIDRSSSLSLAIRRFEIAYTLDRENSFVYLNDIIKHDSRRISHMVYKKMVAKEYCCVQASEKYFYDADVYCGKNYKVVVSHDLDVLLFGSHIIIKEFSPVKMVTIDEFMYRGDVDTKEELIRLCIYLGTDYHNDIVFSKND